MTKSGECRVPGGKDTAPLLFSFLSSRPERPGLFLRAIVRFTPSEVERRAGSRSGGTMAWAFLLQDSEPHRPPAFARFTRTQPAQRQPCLSRAKSRGCRPQYSPSFRAESAQRGISLPAHHLVSCFLFAARRSPVASSTLALLHSCPLVLLLFILATRYSPLAARLTVFCTLSPLHLYTFTLFFSAPLCVLCVSALSSLLRFLITGRWSVATILHWPLLQGAPLPS